ncbi:DNA adenine methylase [Staphylococcus hominis subsp. hominis]|uniref:Dam family site-specific DNA-(adenine-N6)-methyltransferase n=1 Tax=Staphylococcus hominis TaxID=1290 RepID=UPI000CD1C405|nr:Dam family site-specific DNA-(adenine-N6)-methyltransferase [Staphylococcus hominis]AYY66213.1 Dam family site-specific DNA-(adenine-N6)-methyltransferase [Staphylococcus hominis]MDS3906922.1 Dam family site-specific DNA-(adenine-N6)-methyltransferase [Staphylococcus hominis]PNZ31595.1 DNA adenine methylase [Staphylococcus hominis subsp. hominis]SUM40527.1 modification methylase FokI [Staphylococcus hominis]
MRYIGSKSLLLKEIDSLIEKHKLGDEKIFLDLFAGTNTVARYFKSKYQVITNDILYFSYINSKATIVNNKVPQFSKLKFNPFEYLNNEINIAFFNESEYYSQNYTPLGKAMYLSIENGKRLDFMRYSIEKWKDLNLLEEYEYFYLLSCLIEAIPYVSNITGTYGAFLKHWDKRALQDLTIRPLEVINNNHTNIAYNMNANELIKNITSDICYIDIPYNNRQYASNYHLLENVARNNHPELQGKTKIFDWSYLKSDYSVKKKAYLALEDLIANINASHILLSYNDEGIITYTEILNLLKKYSSDNNVDIVTIPYRKYQSKIPSSKLNLNEYIFYIKKSNIKKIDKNIATNIKTNNNYIKSPLNYIGGKYKLLNQILPLFPSNISTFLDLFSGGANVGINVDAKNHVFVDMNSKVNEMFRFFASQNPNQLIEKIEKRISEFELSKTNNNAYLKFRDLYNSNPNPLDLFILIAYSYNHQIRFNNNMKFNNPFGKNRSHFSLKMKKNLSQFISRLQYMNYDFIDAYFDEVDLSFLDENSLVYLDPPYLITTGSYNDGNRGFKNWGIKEEAKMYKLLNELTENNIRYALSNVLEHKNTTHTMLNDFINSNNVEVNYLNYTYDNSSYNTKRAKSVEVLITNYDTKTYKLLKKR